MNEVMNPIIERLKAEATYEEFDYRARPGESHYNHVLDVDRFAELLLLEAARNVSSNPNIGTSLAASRMLEHFGVEQ